MPRTIETKVGARNREASATSVQWLGEDDNGEVVAISIADFFEPLLDQDGDFYATMVAKGLGLDEGTDYRLMDSDGNQTTLKSGPEKVRREIVTHLARELNVPTSVKLPDGGANVAANSRNWVAFRPRMDTPFVDDAARIEYIAKNE